MRGVRRRSFANLRNLLGFALAVAALLAPLTAFAVLANSGVERPERPEITELDVHSFEFGTPSRAPGIAAPASLPAAPAPTPPPLPEEREPGAHASTADQLRWYVAHGTTSSLH